MFQHPVRVLTALMLITATIALLVSQAMAATPTTGPTLAPTASPTASTSPTPTLNPATTAALVVPVQQTTARDDQEHPLAEDWTHPTTSRRQPELYAYLRDVADRFDLRRDIVFNCTVVRLDWDATAHHWRIQTSAGERVAAIGTGPSAVQSSPRSSPPSAS